MKNLCKKAFWCCFVALLFVFAIIDTSCNYQKSLMQVVEAKAKVLAEELYTKRDVADIEQRSQLYSNKILTSKILYPKEGEAVEGHAKPILNNPESGEYMLLVEATAYWVLDPVEASGDGIAYDGTPAVPYRTIAVDPKIIPLQSEVYVPTVGWCRANDTGNAIKGNIIDVSMPTRDDAFAWGRQLCCVRIRPPKV